MLLSNKAQANIIGTLVALAVMPTLAFGNPNNGFDNAPLPGVFNAPQSLRAIACTDIVGGDELKALKVARLLATKELARSKGVNSIDGREVLKNGELSVHISTDTVAVIRPTRELRSGTVTRNFKLEACSEIEEGS